MAAANKVAAAFPTRTDPAIRPEAPDNVETIEAVTMTAFREAPHTSHTAQHIVLLHPNRPMAVLLFHVAAVILYGHVHLLTVTNMTR